MSGLQITFMVTLFITGLLCLSFCTETGGERVRFGIASLVMAVILGYGLGLLPHG